MTGPYGAAARTYFDSGWSPVPFPPNAKWPPVDGFTGAHGEYVDEVTLRRWLKPRTRVAAGKLNWVAVSGNIGLRLPKDILGIDVDMYEGKAGRATLAAAEAAWGPLPATWYSSARADGSGIRLFRVPAGLAWPGKLPQGGGVELIRWDHRYVICAPSIHPDTGQAYQWWTDGIAEPSRDVFPDPTEADLPELPEAWVEGLTSGRLWTDRPAADMDDKDVRSWLEDRNGPDTCATMRSTLTKYTRLLRTAGDDGGAHDAGRDGAWALIGDAGAGHSGVSAALAKLRKVFCKAVARRADDRLANEEWARIVIRGVQKVAAEGEPETDDICALLANSRSNSADEGGATAGSDHDRTQSGSAAFDYARDDVGNAMRLVNANKHDLRYTNALGGWLVWSPTDGRWVLDVDGEVRRRAIAVVRGMEAEAEFIEETAQRAAFLKFVRSCGNLGRLTAMVTVAADMNGVTVPATGWDADGAFLGAGLSGHIELLPNPGVCVHPVVMERRITLATGVGYDPSARSPLWESFLERFVPDTEIRLWLQKLVGYSLRGGNPQRLLVVGFGQTSSGKTTFAEALRVALGDYAATTNMTVFRDNQDERARADLVHVLSRRFVYAEEASSNWHLHPDQVKRLTGGSPIKARLPFAREYFERVPAFTPWLFTNNAPTIEGADNAFWRRVRVVPFDQTIPEDEEDVAAGLALRSGAASAAVLAWAVRGWELYAQAPDLSTPAPALAATERFRRGVSDLDNCLVEICDFGTDFLESPVLLYRAYQVWCSQNGVTGKDVVSNTRFGRFLSGLGVEKVQRKTPDGPRWYRRGVRITDAWKTVIGVN